MNDNKVNSERSLEIEKSTREQSSSLKWFKERKFRLTASKFGEILKCTENRDLSKFCEELFSPPSLSSPAVVHGKTYESVAIEEFEKVFGTKVFRCGLFVNEAFPNYAATPDGVIDDNTILEVKCPFNARLDKISESKSISFLERRDDGVLHLKPSHSYFAQIQDQLAISKRKSCIFLVYTFKDLQIFQVDYDSYFVEKKLLPTLNDFYLNVYLPFLTKKL